MGILRLCDEHSAVVRPDTSAADAIQLMLARRVGAVAVVDGSRLAGIFTERDVLSKLVLSGRDPARVAVGELMTSPVETIGPDTRPEAALTLMSERHIRHLPIVDTQGKLLGMLSVRNLLQAQVEELSLQVNSMEQSTVNDAQGG
jgi:CBS domain-containing protein